MSTPALVSEVSKVFGIPRALAIDFLHAMDESQKDIPPDFFGTFLRTIPEPQYFELPTKPIEPTETTNFVGKPFPPSVIHSRKAAYEEHLARYTAQMEKFAGRMIPLENEVHIPSGEYKTTPNGFIVGRFPRGNFATVKPNTSRPTMYVYKIQTIPQSNPAAIKDALREALVNIILQMDPRARNSVMKLYSVYQRPTYSGVELVFRLEALEYSLVTAISAAFSEDLEKNKTLFLKLYGPFLETLHYLRDTYDFRHGDLHMNNMMLPRSTDLDHMDTTTPHIHMIDFGFSGLKLGDARYGSLYSTYHEDFDKEFEIFRITFSAFPATFQEQLRSYDLSEDLETFIIRESKKLAGGRRKTRKHNQSRRLRKRRYHKK